MKPIFLTPWPACFLLSIVCKVVPKEVAPISAEAGGGAWIRGRVALGHSHPCSARVSIVPCSACPCPFMGPVSGHWPGSTLVGVPSRSLWGLVCYLGELGRPPGAGEGSTLLPHVLHPRARGSELAGGRAAAGIEVPGAASLPPVWWFPGGPGWGGGQSLWAPNSRPHPGTEDRRGGSAFGHFGSPVAAVIRPTVFPVTAARTRPRPGLA